MRTEHTIKPCSTVRAFVKDLCLRGRSDDAVLAVSRSTRWSSSRDEVETLLERRGRKWRIKGKKIQRRLDVLIPSLCGKETTLAQVIKAVPDEYGPYAYRVYPMLKRQRDLDREHEQEEEQERRRTARKQFRINLRLFVRRRCLKGRSDKEVIRAARTSAQWSPHIKRVRQLVQKRGAKWRRNGRRQRHGNL